MTKRVFVIHGPNLNILGKREPEIYGTETLGEINRKIEALGDQLGIQCQFFQSNLEGELVGFIQKAGEFADGIIINPAGYGQYSVIILDALKSLHIPKVEVHIPNIFAGNGSHHDTLTATGCTGAIAGLGADGYLLALRFLADNMAK